MATRGLLASVTRWMENCLGAEFLRRQVPPARWMFLRYEDFVAEPRTVVSRVLEFLGEDTPAPFIDGNTVVLGKNHTVAGNPNRFRVGEVTIAFDDEWLMRLALRRQLAVRVLAWPLILRYRYRLSFRTTTA